VKRAANTWLFAIDLKFAAYQTSAPAAPSIGEIWVDSDDTI
jgi:hypothetical protein